MSWRRFCALLSGLLPGSRWYLALAADGDGPRELSGAALEAYVERMFPEEG